MSSLAINLSNTKLFKPIKVGDITLENRLAYAPCTRTRTTYDNVPTDSMLEYYRQRAENNGGLLIFEATSPVRDFGIYPPTSPVIDTPQQVQSFKKIVDAVHKEGSYASLQLWHMGRGSSIKGIPCKAPSKVYDDIDRKRELESNGIKLEELGVGEIKQISCIFAQGAQRAINEAGFDFIEIHSAFGYLLDEFLQDSVNHRTDEYGGSIENKARFILEVVDSCIEAVGAERIGIRLSPYGYVPGSGQNTINPIIIWGYILSELERRAQNGKKLAYVSVIISEGHENERGILDWVQLLWKGVIVIAGGFLDKAYINEFGEYINSHENTIVAIGRQYLSNPDLVNRLRNGYPLTPYDSSTFDNGPTNVGYLTYAKYGDQEDHSKDYLELQPLA